MTASRGDWLESLSAVVALWKGSTNAEHADRVAQDASLATSHRGQTEGRGAVIEALQADFAHADATSIAIDNRVVRGKDGHAAVSAYFHGLTTTNGAEAQFGGLIVLDAIVQSGEPRVRAIRIQVTWVEGDTTLLEGWHLPLKRQWKPGDQTAAIVSERDAPWHRFAQSEIALSDEEAIAEAWFRYAWALDQADFALFDGAFDEDIEADLMPMGRMRGKRLLMGTLKAFRMPWPWMQHLGALIGVEIAEDRSTARMVLGRIIPGHAQAPDGGPLYVAHYQIALTNDVAHGWRLRQLNYHPGWISPSQDQNKDHAS